MKTLHFFLFIAIVLLFSNCTATENFQVEDPIIEFEKTYCGGMCPVFTVKISNKGVATYEGKDNVVKKGLYTSKLTKEQLDGILNEFDKIDFFSFKDSYKSFMMDLPTKFISYSKNGQKKKIEAYDNIPEGLINLIKQLDALIESLEWKKVD